MLSDSGERTVHIAQLLGVPRATVSGHSTRKKEPVALDAEYRHFDTAAAYGNEKQVGTALARKF